MSENLDSLIKWLGPEAARAALECSDLTVAEIVSLDAEYASTASQKTKRADAIRAVISARRRHVFKSEDELMKMDAASLAAYFHEVKASRDELLEMLSRLDIRPGAVAKKNLMEFAAREISEIGMYRRVAGGRDKSFSVEGNAD